MTEIKRYTCDVYYDVGMIGHSGGEYVTYEDHAAVVAALNEQVQALAAAQKRIAELEAKARIGQQIMDNLTAQAIKAWGELKRRDALEPVAYIEEDLNGLSFRVVYPTTLKAGDKIYCDPISVLLNEDKEQIEASGIKWRAAD